MVMMITIRAIVFATMDAQLSLNHFENKMSKYEIYINKKAKFLMWILLFFKMIIQ